MFVIGNFIIACAKILHYTLSLYMWIIIIRALLSWVNPDPYNKIVQVIYSITDPVTNFFRRKLPLSYGGLDFSPIVVILLIVFLQEFLINSLFTLGMGLR